MTTTNRALSRSDIPLGAETDVARKRRFHRRGWRLSKRPDPVLVIAIVWLSALIFAGVFADVLPIANPTLPDYDNLGGPPSLAHPLGGDYLGRDILSRAIYGARVDLVLGFFAVLISVLVGSTLGVIAGYRGGHFGRVVMVMTDVILAFPALVFIIAIVAVFGSSLLILILALGLLGIPSFIRISRAHTMVLRKREFVMAARAYGAKPVRIVLREIVPSLVLPIAAYAFVIIGVFIVAAGALSFLGLGVPPPTPTWGSMIAEGRADLITHPHAALMPAAVMFMTVLSANIIGQHLQGRVDIRETVL
ncbi:ABC transporter permease [Microbacterium immunditiarum]|uniref:Peptide/nickel transport system permease protein n=1 Tax=Microbacterium immunditiarum TaxID=337480 RepID=A0A7Y9GM04_9MICO|nr:ABC transporter permease [Microbacterium immunditiarum]NYE18963.1 peptide/nickel transport system permease protein [Microbacterium immunditiarum]